MDITYKKITTGLRPIRIAVFFNKNSVQWRSTVEGIIELFSTIWGGKYNIIVPTDGNIIEDKFLQILKEFNPDICCYYRHTNLDFLYSSEGFEAKESMIKAMMERHSSSRAEAELKIAANIKTDELDIFKDNEQFIEYIKTNLSIFGNKDKLRLIKWHWRTKQSLGSLKIEDYFSEVREFFSSPYYFDYDKCSEDFRLLLASYTGIGRHLSFNRLDITSEEVVNEYSASLLSDFYNNRVLPQYPFAISGYGISETIEFLNVDTNKIPYVLVVGSSASDYAFFYGMSKIMHGIYWIPSLDCFREQYTGIGYVTIMKIVDEGIVTGDDLLNITSCSLTTEELKHFVVQIRNLPIPECADGSLKIEIVDPNNIEIKRYVHCYEHGNAYNTYIQQFDDGVSTNFIQSPYPRRFKSVPAHKADWVIDYHIEGVDKDGSTAGYILPNDHTLISNLFDNVSVYRFGPDYLRKNGNKYSIRCPFQMLIYTQMTLEDITPRPILKLQESVEIFKHIFSNNGYLIESSDKGKYVKYCMDLLGSMNALADILKKEEVCNLLQCYNNPTEPKVRKQKGIRGIKLKSSTYLNYDDFRSFFGNDEAARDCMNDFICKNILSRGFIFKCEQCDNSGWYHINSVTETFICGRCDHKQVYLPKHWKEGQEPTFYYRLNEMLYQGFKHNMKVPLLGVAYLQSQTSKSFFFEPELNVIDISVGQKNKMEIDFACLVDGELWIGEGKSGELSARDVDKYVAICNKLGATFILVSTDEISEEMNRNIRSLAWKRPPVLKVIN